MCRFKEDLRSKIELKQKSNKTIGLSYLKAFLDMTVWIVFIYRISNLFARIKLFPISKIFWLINRVFFSVDIDPRSDLAGGFVVIHGLGIVIGHETKTLGRVKIYQGATIGGNIGKRKNIYNRNTGQPVIEDNVTIGIGAAVLGPIVVGANSIIGTHAIATKDVSANSVVVESNKILRSDI
jgi:serine O-acetyltransferase